MRVACPICHQTTTWEENKHRPFCSERCRLIDLGRWASADYRIPTEESPSADTGLGGAQDGSTGSPERDSGDGA